MVFNPEIKAILREAKIDESQGLLCLLAIFFNLEADTTISEEVLKRINITHIVEKDYSNGQLKWNIPLFEGGEAGSFDWVRDWMIPFKTYGGSQRAGVFKEVQQRMKEFFAKNPEFRKEDVYAARDSYFRTATPVGQFVKLPHKFIYEGMGVSKTSQLLMWCERLKENQNTADGSNPMAKGKIIT